MDEAHRILEFLAFSENLKKELRHSWLSDGRQESVAEHSYQMALMAILMHRHLEHSVDLPHTLKLTLVHDLVEAEVGDIPFFEKSERKKAKTAREQAAIKNIREMLDLTTGQELYELWHEFENGITLESKFARALDNLEVQIQHNLADLSTWEPIEYELVDTKMSGPCAHDSFLKHFADEVRKQAHEKVKKAGD